MVSTGNFALPKAVPLPGPFYYKKMMKKGFCFDGRYQHHHKRRGIEMFGRISMPRSCGGDIVCNIMSKAIGPNAALALSGCINTKEIELEVGVENIKFSSTVLLLSGGVTFATKFGKRCSSCCSQ